MIDFFYWNQRNAVGVIEGPEQAGLFFLAMAAALLFTLLWGSLVNHWRLRGNVTHSAGLEALRENTWFQAVWRHWVSRR